MINTYRATIRDFTRGRERAAGRYLIIERTDKDGKPVRKLREIPLADGRHGRGTWTEVKTQLAGYNLRAVQWEPVQGGLQSKCVTM